jgi:hypothetical protein
MPGRLWVPELRLDYAQPRTRHRDGGRMHRHGDDTVAGEVEERRRLAGSWMDVEWMACSI